MCSNISFSFPTSEEPLERKERIQYLRDRWNDSTKLMTKNRHEAELANIANKWFDKLVDLHSGEERSYHTLCHLEEMFAFVDILIEKELRNPINTDGDASNTFIDQARVVLAMAIFFHDSIYNPKSGTNEEDSADLYGIFEKELLNIQHVNGETKPWVELLSEHVRTFILATKSHATGENKENNLWERCLHLFLDADMAVLGKQPLAYNHYASLIRKEYDHVPMNIYCEKRAQILESFLNDGETNCGIFTTKSMRFAFEDQAVSNLKREIQSLKSGIIPCGQ